MEENITIKYLDHPKVAQGKRLDYIRFRTDSEEKTTSVDEIIKARVVIGHNSTLLLLAKHLKKTIYIVKPKLLKEESVEARDIDEVIKVFNARKIFEDNYFTLYKDNGSGFKENGKGVPFLKHPKDTNIKHETILERLLTKEWRDDERQAE